jgi:hypothetical protein
MRKFFVVILLGLLIAGSAFAEPGGYGQTAQTAQTISGTLQVVNGVLAIINASNQVYYVPNLHPYYGSNGLCVNTYVTVWGAMANNSCSPYGFMVGGTWYILPGNNNNVPPVQLCPPPVQQTYVPPQQIYVPPVQQTYVPPIVVLVVPMYTPPQGHYPRY